MGRHKSEYSLLERLLMKVIINQSSGCWEYQGGKNNIGYGMIRDNKRMRTAHRVSYEEHSQTKIPSHLVVMHSCDNTLCVNPQHLSLGTRSDNTQDMLRKGRAKPWGGPRTGKKQPKKCCPHCNRHIAINVFDRYHNDNCKFKSINIL